MNRPLGYHISQMVVGVGLALIAVSDVVTADHAGFVIPISTALMIVGGVGILLGNGYHVLTDNADRVDMAPVSFWLSVIAAVFVLLAGVLSLAV